MTVSFPGKSQTLALFLHQNRLPPAIRAGEFQLLQAATAPRKVGQTSLRKEGIERKGLLFVRNVKGIAPQKNEKLLEDEAKQSQEFFDHRVRKRQEFIENIKAIKAQRDEFLKAEEVYKNLVVKKTQDTGALVSIFNKDVRTKVFQDVAASNNPETMLYQIAQERKQEVDNNPHYLRAGISALVFGWSALLISKKFIKPSIARKLTPLISRSKFLQKHSSKLGFVATHAAALLLGATGGKLSKYLSVGDNSYQYGLLDKPIVDTINQNFLNRIHAAAVEAMQPEVREAEEYVFPDLLKKEEQTEPSSEEQGPTVT